MSNVLLVEPSYHSKFPPLGLLRIASFHRRKGDHITFVRGKDQILRTMPWHRIYIASLFTWELPRTLDTIRYYVRSVNDPKDLFVGGIGVTLLPQYVRENLPVTVVEGPLDKPGMLGPETPAIADLIPDYGLLDRINHSYQPADTFFVRITRGCVRRCGFCAVPILEKDFGIVGSVRRQLRDAIRQYGEKQHLIVLDNNILGIDDVPKVIREIRGMGFAAGAKRNGRERNVDFNQGLDARLISDNPPLARELSRICLSPLRLAYDFMGMKKPYEHAVHLLAETGVHEFTNYLLFNYNDTPHDLFERMWHNARLNTDLGIRITGFPMRFIPMNDVHRGHVAKKWRWRYLRGIQCVLLATRGLVSPNPTFLAAAFGETFEEFTEILSMPDRYIVYRDHFKTRGADDWRRRYRRLSEDEKEELLQSLWDLHRYPKERKARLAGLRAPFNRIIEHYYPNGGVAPRTVI